MTEKLNTDLTALGNKLSNSFNGIKSLSGYTLCLQKRELYEDETTKYIPVPRHKGCHVEVYNLDMILYLTYKIPSRNARIFRRYMTNKAYARNPYEHICIIIDDVDFKAGIHTQME